MKGLKTSWIAVSCMKRYNYLGNFEVPIDDIFKVAREELGCPGVFLLSDG